MKFEIIQSLKMDSLQLAVISVASELEAALRTKGENVALGGNWEYPAQIAAELPKLIKGDCSVYNVAEQALEYVKWKYTLDVPKPKWIK